MGHANDADIAFGRPLDRLNADNSTGDHHVELVLFGAPDAQRNIRLRSAAQTPDGLHQAHTLDRITVHMGDQIAGLDAGPIGGRIGNRRNHPD